MAVEPYFVTRILDTYLREDLFAVVSQGQIRSTPPDFPPLADHWLRFDWQDRAPWWLPLQPSQQLQSWRAAAPLVLEEGSGRTLSAIEDVMAPVLARADEQEALREELACALSHHDLCQQAQREWFAEPAPQQFSSWWESLAYYERLAAFLDHPYYPTARAKVGLDTQSLQLYAPEFAQIFDLKWLAVPKQGVQGQLPADWPQAQGDLAVPVHPHTAPRLQLPPGSRWLDCQPWPVRATLSVRTVSLVEQPHIHLKLPLLMRSLSYKNLRKIRPDTIADGHTVQQILAQRVPSDCLLSDESTGFSVDQRADLGCILRRYPDLGCQRVLPVAALLAPEANGATVMDNLAQSHFQGRLQDFLRTYLDLTLRIHIPLWVRHGIALESNQQNTLVVLDSQGRMRLLLKDNDAARIYEAVARTGQHFHDPCLQVDDWLPIAQMFITITFQLNIVPLIEASPEPKVYYRLTRQLAETILDQLPPAQVEACQIRSLWLDSALHPVKYLYSSGTLFSKQRTGASDINKHYGLTGPNPLRHV